jgi:hypothetical protein
VHRQDTDPAYSAGSRNIGITEQPARRRALNDFPPMVGDGIPQDGDKGLRYSKGGSAYSQAGGKWDKLIPEMGSGGPRRAAGHGAELGWHDVVGIHSL